MHQKIVKDNAGTIVEEDVYKRQAVDDGVIVPLAGFHLDEFGVFETGGPVTDLVVVAHSDRAVSYTHLILGIV